jgi:hypothetical protein
VYDDNIMRVNPKNLHRGRSRERESLRPSCCRAVLRRRRQVRRVSEKRLCSQRLCAVCVEEDEYDREIERERWLTRRISS